MDGFSDRDWPLKYVANGAQDRLFIQRMEDITGYRNLKYITKQLVCVKMWGGHGLKWHQTKYGAIPGRKDYASGFSVKIIQTFTR